MKRLVIIALYTAAIFSAVLLLIASEQLNTTARNDGPAIGKEMEW